MRRKETVEFGNIEEFCDIGSIWEFYDRLGLLDQIKTFEIMSPNDIYLNKEDSDRLQELIKAEARRRGKRERVWSRTPAVPSRGCFMEWLTYGPLSELDIPRGKVYFYRTT